MRRKICTEDMNGKIRGKVEKKKKSKTGWSRVEGVQKEGKRQMVSNGKREGPEREETTE